MEYTFKKRGDYIKHRTAFLANHVQSGKCERCGKTAIDPQVMLTCDHVIPQQILLAMGFDMERWWDDDNIKILCRACNAFKAGRLDFSDPITKMLLLKYLERV